MGFGAVNAAGRPRKPHGRLAICSLSWRCLQKFPELSLGTHLEPEKHPEHSATMTTYERDGGSSALVGHVGQH